MRIREIMKTRVETISASDSAETARTRMASRRIRHLVVTAGREVLGVISERDLDRLGTYRQIETVGENMTAPAVTVAPETTLRQAANLLRGRTIGCLPVLEDGKLAGIVTTTDLLELLGRGAETSHVEEIADLAASTLDVAFAPPSAAVVIVRRRAQQGRGDLVAHMAQFRHPRDKTGGSGPSKTRHTLDDLGEFCKMRRGLDHGCNHSLELGHFGDDLLQ